MRLARQTAAWYDRLATFQEGYAYPWRSRLAPGHGEDAYLALVRRCLHQDAAVLDVACGHGAVALNIAPQCRSLLGYDRTAPWIELARRAAHRRDLTNATFVHHDSSPEANGGRSRIPALDRSFDLLICSKGPFHWIADARRVARPGATLVMLVPDATPLTPWHAWLPESLRWQETADPHWARPRIEQYLAEIGLTLHSWWSFDVPEVFSDARQLYTWLAWGYAADEIASLADVRPTLDRIFREHGQRGGVAIPRRRYLWQATMPG